MLKDGRCMMDGREDKGENRTIKYRLEACE